MVMYIPFLFSCFWRIPYHYALVFNRKLFPASYMWVQHRFLEIQSITLFSLFCTDFFCLCVLGDGKEGGGDGGGRSFFCRDEIGELCQQSSPIVSY